jgi:hypothetical protein
MNIEELKIIMATLEGVGDKAIFGFALYCLLNFLSTPVCLLTLGWIVLKVSTIFRTQIRHVYEIRDHQTTHVFPSKQGLADWLAKNGYHGHSELDTPSKPE